MTNTADDVVAATAAERLAANTTTLPTPDRVSAGFLTAAVFLQLSVAVSAVGLALVAWPLVIAKLEPDNKILYLSVVTGLVAAVAVILTPLCGALSDRCTWRMGMRKPFIVFGSLITVAGLLLMGAASNIQLMIMGAVVYAIGNSALTSATWVLIPDQIPVYFRSRAQGFMMGTIAISGLVAAIFFPLLIGNQFVLFAVPAVIKIVAVALVLILLKDRKLSPEDAPERLTVRSFVQQFKFSPRAVPDFSWAWAAKVVFIFGTVLGSTYGVYLLTDKIGVGPEELAGVLQINGLLGLATALGGAIFGGWLSDKIGRRKSLVVLAALMFAIGAVTVAFAPSVLVFIVGSAFMGLGSGLHSPVDGALAIDLLPGEGKESGKYMSVMAVGDQLPRAIGPFVGTAIIALGALTAVGGYTVAYLIAAGAAVLAAVMIFRIKGSR